MLRIKNEEELRDDGWIDNGDGYGAPCNARHAINFVYDMWHVAGELNQATLQVILELGPTDCRGFFGYDWTSDMVYVVDVTRPATVRPSLCSCLWNKHPLYCNCPK